MARASITTWNRLEPRVREFSMERGLQAQVRDPMWMLARQWQLGEFTGSDGGSPVSARVDTTSIPLTSYRPGDATGAVTPLAGDVPLEAHVERAPVQLGLRGSVQLGQRFEHFARLDGLTATLIDLFRDTYAIDRTVPATEAADVALFRLAAAGRCADGVALRAAAVAGRADLSLVAPVPSLPTSAERAAAIHALASFLAETDGLYSEPDGDAAWQPRDLDFAFAVGAETADDARGLTAEGFRGGELDWHAFDLANAGIAPAGGAEAEHATQTFVPTNVVFRGMPAARFWSFEDAQTDFGALDAQHVDLAKLLVMEFALIYGGDWFSLPLALRVGTLSSVESLVVTDTFGVRTLIRPTGETAIAGEAPWSLFALTGQPADQDLLLLPPTLGQRIDGPDVEDVLFVRDEMAAMGWAIEKTVQDAIGRPIDGYRAYLERLAATPALPPRVSGPNDPAIEYLLGTTVPDNWLPLVPVQTGERSFVFRRGVMGAMPGTLPPTARSRVLEPGHPYYVADEAVPRAGARVTRRIRRARWTDGSTVVWDGFRSSVGRGEGSSGLEFDTIRRVDQTP